MVEPAKPETTSKLVTLENGNTQAIITLLVKLPEVYLSGPLGDKDSSYQV